jgi:hypothetical protein
MVVPVVAGVVSVAGRLHRSVPVIGSEDRLKMLDFHMPVVMVKDGGDVKSAGAVCTLCLLKEASGTSNHVLLLGWRDSLTDIAILVGGTGFHLDEHDRLAVEHDQIDFASRTLIVPCHKTIPLPAEVPFRPLFARSSDSQPGSHGGNSND